MKETILICDDKMNIREILKDFLSNSGYEVTTAATGEDAASLLKESQPRLLITDLKLPGMSGLDLLKVARACTPPVPVIMITAFGSIPSAVDAMRCGAADYLTKPLDYDLLQIRVERLLQQEEVREENEQLREEVHRLSGMDSMIGESPAMKRLFSIIDTVAPASSNILIQGECGTGKELIARTIHDCSTRHEKPPVIVDCASLPENLLESELFGYEKGAFTGAQNRKKGRIELARGSTLFLDEIGEMGLPLQAKLLRVIQERQFHRIGGLAPVTVDFRLIAATNKDLEKAVKEGSFRSDLYYRLKVVTIEAPPLRDRPEDIPLLAEFFIRQICRKEGLPYKALSPELTRLLRTYPWPGNVRQLQNCVEHMILFSHDDHLQPRDLPREIETYKEEHREPPAEKEGLEALERQAIEDALNQTGGNKTRAAQMLKIGRKSLYVKMKKYGLEDNRDRPEEEE